MDGHGQHPTSKNGQVLHWPGRVLTADDLRLSLNGHREVILTPRAIITPLAQEHLRTNGIAVQRADEDRPVDKAHWAYVQERPHPTVQSAALALQREGLSLREMPVKGDPGCCHWARAVAECVARGDCQGGVVFCDDPGLVCCVSNKVGGLRAAAVANVAQAARATLSLGANLLAVEMPGRTFFEVRQILRALCRSGVPTCPPGVACTLREMEGDAHR
jgi:hypothetical protein